MLTAPWEWLVVDGWRKDEGPGTLSCVFTVLAHRHLCVCVSARVCVCVCVCVCEREQGQ